MMYHCTKAIRIVGFRAARGGNLLYRRITTPSDPWPLPHTPDHLSSTVTPSAWNQIPPLPRPNEKPETLRARLVYQSRKRGTLESDLLLSTFTKEHLDNMTLDELREYDKVGLGSLRVVKG